MVDFMKRLNFTSRDNGRTPMQWTAGPEAGFTDGTPWLPVNENHGQINVARQDTLAGSVLNHFRKLTRLRKEQAALVYGDYALVEAGDPQVYAYTRTLGDQRLLVLLNFGDTETEAALPQGMQVGERLIDNYPEGPGAALHLKPWQAVIFSLR